MNSKPVKFKDQYELRKALSLPPAKNHMPKLMAKFKEIAMQENQDSEKTTDYNPMMTEKGTVDRAIEIENRMEEIERKISYYEHLIFEAGLFGEYPHSIDDKIDELQSELSDLQGEYRG